MDVNEKEKHHRLGNGEGFVSLFELYNSEFFEVVKIRPC